MRALLLGLRIPRGQRRAGGSRSPARRIPVSRSFSTFPLFFSLVLAALLTPQGIDARQVEREVQVPLDDTRGVMELDTRLRDELGLFPEITGFVSARLFRTEAGGNVLEITYSAQGAMARERRRLADAELAALRTDLQTRLSAIGRERVVDRSGRAGFIVGQVVVGLGYHGWVAPIVLGVDGGRGAVAAYLLTSGSSFLIPWMITSNRSVTVAQRDASFWGATRGIAYGLALGSVLGPQDPPADPFDDDPDLKWRVGMGSLVSVLGTVAGYNAARLADHDPGTVALWSAAGDFGLATAFGTSYALGLYDEVECSGDVCFSDDFTSTRRGHLTTLGLGLASLYGAKLWGETEDYTVGDARALRSFGLLGAHALLAPAVETFEDATDDGRKIMASALVGSWAGLYLGNRALRRTSLSGGDGLLVLAGHVAGGLVALGITYLLDDEPTASETVYLATSAGGAALGSLLTFNAVRGGDPLPGQNGRAVPGSLDVERERNARAIQGVSVTFDPGGLLLPVLEHMSQGSRATPVRSAPLLTLRF